MRAVILILVSFAAVINGQNKTRRLKVEYTNDAIVDTADFKWLESWKVPEEIRTAFPYYVSGFDFEKRPVVVLEVGQWKTSKFFNADKETIRNIELYMMKAGYQVSLLAQKSVEDQVVWIVDFEGYALSELRNLGYMKVLQNHVQQHNGTQERFRGDLAYGFFINVNVLAENLLNLLKPYMGHVMGKIDIFGTNSAKWIPQLLRRIPKESLPAWYGGVKDFKPYLLSV